MRTPKACLKKKRILDDFHEAQTHYFNMRVEKALKQFQKVLEIIPDDRASLLYIDRCNHFIRKGVPADWQGYHKMDKK